MGLQQWRFHIFNEFGTTVIMRGLILLLDAIKLTVSVWAEFAINVTTISELWYFISNTVLSRRDDFLWLMQKLRGNKEKEAGRYALNCSTKGLSKKSRCDGVSGGFSTKLFDCQQRFRAYSLWVRNNSCKNLSKGTFSGTFDMTLEFWISDKILFEFSSVVQKNSSQ